MFYFANSKPILVFAVLIVVAFGACSSVNNDTESITDEDIEMAAQIVTASLADDESGMMASMYDAFSDVDESGINYGSPNQGFALKGVNARPPQGERNGRGREVNYVHEYDSVTGIHSISFERGFDDGEFSKSLSVSEEIIFTDLDGNFIARPKAEKDAIEGISFNGTKSGEASAPFRTSSFTKTDEFRISGLHATSPVLSMNGTHHGMGEAEGTLRDSSTTVSRSYEVSISFENVSIEKDTVKAYGNLENGVSGTLTYSIVMYKETGGTPEETLVEGTIDLEEDGTALMRFNKLPQVIRFSLGDGQRHEEGRGGHRGPEYGRPSRDN